MKTIKHLFLAVIATTVLSCSSDDESESLSLPQQEMFKISFSGTTNITQPLASNPYFVTTKYLSNDNIIETIELPVTSQTFEVSGSKQLEKASTLGIQIELFGLYSQPTYSYIWSDNITIKIENLSTNEIVLEKEVEYINTDVPDSVLLMYNTENGTYEIDYFNTNNI